MPKWVNLLKQSANLDDTSSPWAGNGSFTITEVASIQPGETAHQHAAAAGGDLRFQNIGTLGSDPQTLVWIVENIDAVETRWQVFDRGTGSSMAFGRYEWGTGVFATSGSVGSDITGETSLLTTAPNGGELRLLSVTGTPNNPNNNRRIIIEPEDKTGPSTIIPHYAGLFEASTYPPALLVTGDTTPQQRVIDLSDYPIRTSPGANRVQLVDRQPRANGQRTASLAGDASHARVWDFELDLNADATGTEALRDELDAPGTVIVVHNPLIETTDFVGVECEAEVGEMPRGPRETHARLRFRLREVAPV